MLLLSVTELLEPLVPNNLNQKLKQVGHIRRWTVDCVLAIMVDYERQETEVARRDVHNCSIQEKADLMMILMMLTLEVKTLYLRGYKLPCKFYCYE